MTRYCLPRAAYLPMRDAAGIDEHLRQQLVGARAAFVRAEVVDLVEITPLDLVGLAGIP